MAPVKSPVRATPESFPAEENVVRLYEEGSVEESFTALIALWGAPWALPQKNKYADAVVLDFCTALSGAESKALRCYKGMVEAGWQIPPEIEAAGKAAQAKKDAADKATAESARKAAIVRDIIEL